MAPMDGTGEHILISIVCNVLSLADEIKKISSKHKMNFKSISVKLQLCII